MKFFLFLLAMLSCFFLPASAEEAKPLQSNALVEAQVNRLSTELRCLVCQNQTLADSHSGLAEDLRQEIREMASKGMSDQAIIDYLVGRYGDFVRYRPALKSTTVLLWFGPFALFLMATLGFYTLLRKRESLVNDISLSDEEACQVKELLSKE